MTGQNWKVPVKAINYFQDKIRADAVSDEHARHELELLGYSIGICAGLDQGPLTLESLTEEHSGDNRSNEWQNDGFSKLQIAKRPNGDYIAIIKQTVFKPLDFADIYKGMIEAYVRGATRRRFEAHLEKADDKHLVFILSDATDQPLLPQVTEQIKYPLPKGKFTLIEEESPAKANKIFANYVRSGIPGLCMTHIHPRTIRSDMGTDAFEIIYLADDNDSKATNPKRLEFEITQKIGRFLAERAEEVGRENGKPGILYTNAVTNVNQYNGFDPTYKFLDKTAKRLASADSFGLIYLKPGSFSREETQKIRDVIGG
jgi:hypothetical protein